MVSNSDSGDKDPDSPFPSGPEMDLDMWRAGLPQPDGTRSIEAPASYLVAKVYAPDGNADMRDAQARRIEMLGDVYEALRRAAEKMSEAGMDVSDEHAVLAEFVSPKPFKDGE